jgi:hypothetical protein
MAVTASLAFGNIAVGQTSFAKTVTVTNTERTNPLIISAAKTSDPEYALSGLPPASGDPCALNPLRALDALSVRL